MGKIYESMEDYERAAEEEFKAACQEMAYYQGNVERTTIDGEWTESELKDDVWDMTDKVLKGTKDKKGWLELNANRAVKDSDLTKTEFITTDICDRYDLIEVYNRAYDIHRNDKPMLFGIHYFDDLVVAEVNKILKNNLVTN
jgi:hypothetical protein